MTISKGVKTLKDLRFSKDLKRVQVCTEIDLGFDSLQKAELGRFMSRQTCLKLAKFYDILIADVESLFRDSK